MINSRLKNDIRYITINRADKANAITAGMLDELISRPIESGDLLSNANTIILMGKTRDGNKMGRALHVAKHRGSACDESIVPFQINESGLKLQA